LFKALASNQEGEKTEITEWLNKKDTSSVIFVSFGTENYLSKEERGELALGLLLSKVNFIWVLRFAQAEKISAKEALPEGFFDMVGERGLIVEEWAPQKRISSHPGIGGFLSHCGWNSVLESMRFGDPIIAMPLYMDQPLNAGFVVEVGAGLKIHLFEYLI
jgi:cyanidin-3-O-glucoside 2''-O-glucuronosyltransferase